MWPLAEAAMLNLVRRRVGDPSIRCRHPGRRHQALYHQEAVSPPFDSENMMTATPISSNAESGTWPQVNGHGADVGAWLDAAAVAELATAPADAVGEGARKALLPVLPHSALVLVTPESPTFPVQIAAPQGARQRLATIDWIQMIGADLPAKSGVVRLELPAVVGGLRVAGWIARSPGFTVALIVGDRARLSITPGQEQAAMRVVTRAAARVRAIDDDPPPRTLAFSHAMSQERERIRLELRTRHAATLSSLLHTLRSATGGGGAQAAPPGVAKAIDMASRGLLELQAEADARDATGRASIGAAFADVVKEVRGTLHSARMRLVEDLDAGDAGEAAQLPYAVAHAARLVTRLAALNATQHPGADKSRLLWRLTDEALIIIVADNGVGYDDAAERLERELAGIRRLAGELRGRVCLDSNPHWGTTVSCCLPLHDRTPAPETPAARRLSELGDREREVLELMMAGLRNRDIAVRLFISERTVKFHVSNILAKLEVGSRTEAIALAHRVGVPVAPTDAGR
jgi:DNA-binding NarL/FixJ family response regulator